ncbi:MAG: hypothetical protein L0Y56_16915, partial [Nitrospira sp.]|nr:hypothetical protein [Nitrospira sp.]
VFDEPSLVDGRDGYLPGQLFRQVANLHHMNPGAQQFVKESPDGWLLPELPRNGQYVYVIPVKAIEDFGGR